jgi:HPt (histidine-containing phosphotransfer) domain-containing protein
MTLSTGRGVAFSMPGGESSGRPRRRPIDLARLARQTMEDPALEREVLALFAQQSAAACEALKLAAGEERRRLAHGLKGSALAVGAMPIADCAEAIEAAPGDPALARRLDRLVDEVRDFIAAISR